MPDRTRSDYKELVCPSCDYDLRGLPQRERITCPECGYEDDLAGIVVANQQPRQISTPLWIALQLAPLPLFVLSMALSRELPLGTWRHYPLTFILLSGLYWNGRLCWIAFGSLGAPARAVSAMIGAVAFFAINWAFASLVEIAFDSICGA